MDGDRKARLEMQVALYAEAKRPFYGCKLGQTDAAKFGEAEAEIAKTEQRVAIGFEFAQKRGRGTCRIKQFHNGKMVDVGAGGAMGEQSCAQWIGDQYHGKTPCQNGSR